MCFTAPCSLKKIGTCTSSTAQDSPSPIQIGRSKEYEVKYIHSNRTHYQKPQYYVKWKGYLLEESTWELLRNLANAQEAKNRKGGLLGEEGDGVRIANSFPLGTQAQEWDSNPDPESRQAACPHFPEVEPLSAEAKNDGPNSKASQTKGISAPNREVIKAPN
ncbi:hypothetical protein DSO57_1033763 [Entomophthora muscae]|uniref:Uncharacterized protein n=1 Tax=Entomophthora muscae TaxID=34485 RepID=A0ACC2T0B1_9FUNG|nr:hypothetical protein DSO57_1033763 [Entomophthora muscae]